MIAIVNVSSEDAPLRGRNRYEVRINAKVICTFDHDRQPNGLAQCLRDAADAVENETGVIKADALIKLIKEKQG